MGAVILDHVVRWPAGGFVGVDVFFVISGYLITGLLLREYDTTGHISAGAFYRRRVKRVVPAALTVLFVTTMSSWLVYDGGARFRSTLFDSFWSLAFAANWRFVAQDTNYFAEGQLPSPLQHYWSLSVEEQFYLLWPWLMLAMLILGARHHRRGRRELRIMVGCATTVFTAASFMWALHQSSTPTSAYFSSFSRAWELGLGALVAIAAPLFRPLPIPIRYVGAYLGVAGIILSVLVVREGAGFPAPWALWPVMATALVIAAGEGAELRIWPLTGAVANYVGDISYSLYLWHWPVAILLQSYYLPATAEYLLIGLPLIVALSVAGYHLIERPVRDSDWLLPGSTARAHRRLATATTHAGLRYAVLAAGCFALLVFGVSTLRSPEQSLDVGSAVADGAGGGAATEPACLGAVAVLKANSCTPLPDPGAVYPAPEKLVDDSTETYKCFAGYEGVTDPDACSYGAADGDIRIALVGEATQRCGSPHCLGMAPPTAGPSPPTWDRAAKPAGLTAAPRGPRRWMRPTLGSTTLFWLVPGEAVTTTPLPATPLPPLQHWPRSPHRSRRSTTYPL